ncbi:MAG: hypothetical protein QNJ34_07740 [Xenococcaceae cyanobacterium MO_188.B29]|nr:hypothetical protein [Xenococcaceae cyanobacterium MO_188.B29]
MLIKTGIFIGVSAVTIALTSFSAHSQTVQQGTQDASIQGNDNEINQIINQYYLDNPGKGAIERAEPVTEPNNHEQPSTHNNTQQRNSNNREWGQNQGEQRRNSKK